MTPWLSEGFFARLVILVEGEDDRAAFLGVADLLGHDLEAAGVAVIPVGGKSSLDRPFALFDTLRIPTYLVWDGDKGRKGANPKDNERLLRLVGQTPTSWPSTHATSSHTCFEVNLEDTLQAELGAQLFASLLGQCQVEFGIPNKVQALKNPVVVARLLGDAYAKGCASPTLHAAVANALALLS